MELLDFRVSTEMFDRSRARGPGRLTVATAFEWFVDLEVLRRFPQRYARAVDERDHDALAALFDPDGSVDGTRGAQTVPDVPRVDAHPPAVVRRRACTCSATR